MRATWDANPMETWPPWEGLRRVRVNRIYFLALVEQMGFSFNERQLSPEYRKAVSGTGQGEQGFQYGCVRDPHWAGTNAHAILDPAELVQAVKTDIAAIGAVVPYMLDIEFPYRDPDWLIKVFTGIRLAFPTMLLSWTMEPMQGGWIKASPKLVKWINRDVNMVVVGQTFGSKMEPYGNERVRADLEWAGILKSRVRLMYNALLPLPDKWDGCTFHDRQMLVPA